LLVVAVGLGEVVLLLVVVVLLVVVASGDVVHPRTLVAP
jgi:hypothetical protein